VQSVGFLKFPSATGQMKLDGIDVVDFSLVVDCSVPTGDCSVDVVDSSVIIDELSVVMSNSSVVIDELKVVVSIISCVPSVKISETVDVLSSVKPGTVDVSSSVKPGTVDVSSFVKPGTPSPFVVCSDIPFVDSSSSKVDDLSELLSVVSVSFLLEPPSVVRLLKVLVCTVLVGVIGGVLKSVVEELNSLCDEVIVVNCDIVVKSSKLEVLVISVVTTDTPKVERSGVTGGVGISLVDDLVVVVLEIVGGLFVSLVVSDCVALF